MAPKIKNSIIFVVIGSVFVLIYIFFIKKDAGTSALVTTSSAIPTIDSMGANAGDNSVTAEFLSSLLNVHNIKLNDAILSDNAFLSLRDSSIVLIPDGTEGRPNPFAPFGVDIVPVSSVVPVTIETTPPPVTTSVPGTVTITPSTTTPAPSTSIKPNTTIPPVTTPAPTTTITPTTTTTKTTPATNVTH